MARNVQRDLSGREMAGHWTLVTHPRLISFFHSFTSRIPSLASPCRNQIPNCSTATASHGGVSPTCQPAVDDFISIVVDGSMDDRAISVLNKKNACGTRCTTTAGNSRASSQPGPIHPIAVLFRSHELGKAVMGFAIPMTTGLLFNQHQGVTHLQASAIALTLSVGFTATWNGLLLRRTCPRVASALEHFGVGSIFLAFFGLVSYFLPLSLMWACWVCCGLSYLPFFLSLVPPTAAEEERSVERLDQGSV